MLSNKMKFLAYGKVDQLLERIDTKNDIRGRDTTFKM